MSKAAQEFAGLQPMIARYFGSPTKAAGVAGSVAKQVLPDAGASAPRVQAQAPALFQAAASPKQAAPSLFILPKPHPSFAPGTMVMRMQHSSPQK